MAILGLLRSRYGFSLSFLVGERERDRDRARGCEGASFTLRSLDPLGSPRVANFGVGADVV